MYQLSDKVSAIRQVQKFLHFISDKRDSKIPRVSIDGIYGEETREAVSEFQRQNNLSVNGEVDRITFDLLYEAYSDILNFRLATDFIITGEDFPFKLGDQSDDVLIINLLLRELEKSYGDIGTVNKSNYFSHDTENTVRALQKIFAVEQTGIVDRILFQRLKDEVNARKRLREFNR